MKRQGVKKVLLILLGGWLALQPVAADEAGWLTVLDQPMAKAQSNNKFILLFFTGSDWCGWCKKFDQEVLSTPEFREYAQKNLVLVEINFPKQTAQSDSIKKANAAWKERFKVDGFPTLILLDNHFKALGRQDGYVEGGAKAFIQELEQWKERAVPSSQITAGGLQWFTDLPPAQAQARNENKLVLLDFTGSDWCGWCMKLDEDTFSKPEFADYAKKNLVLVQLDFPEKKPQAESLKQANAALQKKYGVDGYPTLIAMKPDGTVVWKQDGYIEGGPPALIAQLDAVRQK